MNKPLRPRTATTFRPSPEDRAAIALLRQELGDSITLNAMVGMGLRELLKKYNLKLPQPAPRKTAKKR